jgi:hypothetical protein
MSDPNNPPWNGPTHDPVTGTYIAPPRYPRKLGEDIKESDWDKVRYKRRYPRR